MYFYTDLIVYPTEINKINYKCCNEEYILYHSKPKYNTLSCITFVGNEQFTYT